MPESVFKPQRLSSPSILTLDERGFRAFRFAGKQHFRLVLQDEYDCFSVPSLLPSTLNSACIPAILPFPYQ